MIYSFYDVDLLPDKFTNKMYEDNFKTLKQNSNKADLVHKQKLLIKYQGVDKQGLIHFTCGSYSRKGKNHNIIIKLLDFEEAKKISNKNKDIMNLAVYGDIAVYCSCESFLYHGFKYMAWTRGYGLSREVRFPKVKNPYLQGTVCKHLIAVFNALPFYQTSFIKDFKSKGLL